LPKFPGYLIGIRALRIPLERWLETERTVEFSR
jgi:hypothetical protein